MSSAVIWIKQFSVDKNSEWGGVTDVYKSQCLWVGGVHFTCFITIHFGHMLLSVVGCGWVWLSMVSKDRVPLDGLECCFITLMWFCATGCASVYGCEVLRLSKCICGLVWLGVVQCDWVVKCDLVQLGLVKFGQVQSSDTDKCSQVRFVRLLTNTQLFCVVGCYCFQVFCVVKSIWVFELHSFYFDKEWVRECALNSLFILK